MFSRFEAIISNALPIFSEKTWAATGKEKGSISALTELAKTVGLAPNTNPYFQVESKGDTHAAYDFDTMADASGNGRDLVAGTATVRVLPCEETWYGVTYREDLDSVKAAIAGMKAKGIYDENLWN